MISEALIFILESLVHLFVLAVLLRFYAQAFRAPFRNPITDFAVALTDWAVKPMRKIVPGMMKLDMASFLVAWIGLTLLAIPIFLLRGYATVTQVLFWPGVLVYAFVAGLKLSLFLLIGVLLVQAVLSWVSPYHPIRPFFDALARPFVRPLQRVVPLVGGVDLSPLIVILIAQVILMLPIALLERVVVQVVRMSVGA